MDVHRVIPLRLGDFRIGGEFGFLARLLGLGGTNHRIPVGLGLGDLGVAFDLGDARLAQGVQVALLVPNVTNRKADDAQAHVGHVPGGNLLHLRGKLVAVLINIFHGHRPKNRAQVALERLHRDTLDVVGPLAQELFGGGGNRDVIAFDLDLGHAVHHHRHPFAGIDLRRLHINGQQLQRQHIHLLEHRDDERAAAFDHAKTPRLHAAIRVNVAMLAPGDDQHLVRTDLRVTTGPNGQEDENHDYQAGHDNGNGAQVRHFSEEGG